MPVAKPKKPLVQTRVGSPASEEDITIGLTFLAHCDGNVRRAARESGINRGTLRGWRIRHPDKYFELQQIELPKMRMRVAEKALEIAEQAHNLEGKMMVKVDEELEAGSITGRELLNGLRNVSVVKGVSLTHANNYHGDPAQEKDKNSIEDAVAIMSKLQRIGLIKKVDATQGEPVLEAEVVEDSP